MKQNTGKTTLIPKTIDPQSSKVDLRNSKDKQHSHSIQQLKSSGKEGQLSFKKAEKLSKQRLRECSNQRRESIQVKEEGQGLQLGEEKKMGQRFSQKFPRSDRFTIKQQYEQNKFKQIGKKQNRIHPQSKNTPDAHSQHSVIISAHIQHQNQKQFQKKSKKEAKLLKKSQKERTSLLQSKIEVNDRRNTAFAPAKESISQTLLQLFKEKYPYYLLQGQIVFPIEDTLFSTFPELQLKNCAQVSKEAYIQPLPSSFRHELQIWNMLVEHPGFFQVADQLTIEDIPRILSNSNDVNYKKLFKNVHNFYLNDMLNHRYQDCSNQDYFSFLSLWKYSQQNNFMDKLFHTSWNKFQLFYISLQKNHYSNLELKSEYERIEKDLIRSIELGEFYPPNKYCQLLDYLLFLVGMSYQTVTFRNLINNKMLFFRDNNKLKNQMLQQKKNLQNQLWELKELEKNNLKEEKAIAKTIKKEMKNRNQQTVNQLIANNEQISRKKLQLAVRKEAIGRKICDIDNRIYELCCLPEFSNVWLLGEDRHKNLYWFVREQEFAIYREMKQTGEWGAIKNQNIGRFHETLNAKGIRESKLYDKILYYQQLGYLKFQKPIIESNDKMQAQHPEISSSKMNCQQLSSKMQIQQKYFYDVGEFDRFNYTEFTRVTPYIIRLMILKSEWMMTKYLYERNSKWTAQEQRHQYISKMTTCQLTNYADLTQQLRTFNEKICVVEINIKIVNETEGVDLKTRKIQTKIWGINEKYKHSWYDYSRRCKSLSDLHFLVSVLYLTIQKYVTKTRKPNNTKYFYKTVEFGEMQDIQQTDNHFDLHNSGQIKMGDQCQTPYHSECMSKHKQGKECSRKDHDQYDLMSG